MAKKILFHTPSEHTIGTNKMRTDMEIQIIHYNDKFPSNPVI